MIGSKLCIGQSDEPEQNDEIDAGPDRADPLHRKHEQRFDADGQCWRVKPSLLEFVVSLMNLLCLRKVVVEKVAVLFWTMSKLGRDNFRPLKAMNEPWKHQQ